jgi:hypothetical protein
MGYHEIHWMCQEDYWPSRLGRETAEEGADTYERIMKPILTVALPIHGLETRGLREHLKIKQWIYDHGRGQEG